MAGELIQICRVPSFLGISGNCQWRKNDLTYTITRSLPGLDDAVWLDAVRMAWSFMEAVCNIRATYIENVQDADLRIDTGGIDGAAGVLAWSEMPCGNSDPDQLKQLYDSGEMQWVIAENPGRNQLDIVRVGAHEIMHFLGVPHAPRGIKALIMSMYSAEIRRPLAYDIAELQARYGPPLLLPPPTTPPPTTPPPIPPVTPPGGNVMNWLAMLQALLALLATLFPPTPSAPGAPASPGTIIDWIRKILTAFGAGATITAENLDAAYQTLRLPEVTEAQLDAPVQAMMME